jgi:hypothetical protein
MVESHREGQPIEQVLRFGTERELNVSHRVAAIGEKLDRLVHLKALELEQLEPSALGLFVRGLHKRKALDGRVGLLLTAAKRQNAFACNDLEPALLHPLRFDVTPSMPTVNAHLVSVVPQSHGQPSINDTCSSPSSSSSRSASLNT